MMDFVRFVKETLVLRQNSYQGTVGQNYQKIIRNVTYEKKNHAYRTCFL